LATKENGMRSSNTQTNFGDNLPTPQEEELRIDNESLCANIKKIDSLTEIRQMQLNLISMK
jgi:hypothetical protein